MTPLVEHFFSDMRRELRENRLLDDYNGKVDYHGRGDRDLALGASKSKREHVSVVRKFLI